MLDGVTAGFKNVECSPDWTSHPDNFVVFPCTLQLGCLLKGFSSRHLW